VSRLSDILDGALRSALGNHIINFPTLSAQAAASPHVKTANAIQSVIGGVTRSRAALASQSIAVTHRFDGSPVSTLDPAYVQPNQTTVTYLLAVNAAGTLACVQGCFVGQQITFSGDKSKVITGDGAIPVEPDGYVGFCLVKVTTGGASTFTPGTTNLDAAGLTVSMADCKFVPATF